MPKCPECGKEITFLRDFSPSWQEFSMTIGADGYGHFENEHNVFPMENEVPGDELECPECDQVLFTNVEEAEKFLREGKTADEVRGVQEVKE